MIFKTVSNSLADQLTCSCLNDIERFKSFLLHTDPSFLDKHIQYLLDFINSEFAQFLSFIWNLENGIHYRFLFLNKKLYLNILLKQIIHSKLFQFCFFLF